MKILLSTPTFSPNVGGMETVAETLADLLVEEGHSCIVYTPVKSNEENTKKYQVIRNANFLQKIRACQNADLIFSNGASLYMFLPALIARKPFVWLHQGYQVSCIDGLGWHAGTHAPLTPWQSFKHHLLGGPFLKAVHGFIRVIILQLVARYQAKSNIMISQWVADRLELPNQIVLANTFPTMRFQRQETHKEKLVYDFCFLGRLVSEKGADTLIKAFSVLQTGFKNNLKLVIIGAGPEDAALKQLARDLGVANSINFLGSYKNQALADVLHKCRIAVVPSKWEEPFGGVTLELLAAGVIPIVSNKGALPELIGNAGLTFDSTSVTDLATKMEMLHNDEELQVQLRKNSAEQLDKFNEKKLIKKYINLFEQLI